KHFARPLNRATRSSMLFFFPVRRWIDSSRPLTSDTSAVSTWVLPDPTSAFSSVPVSTRVTDLRPVGMFVRATFVIMGREGGVRWVAVAGLDAGERRGKGGIGPDDFDGGAAGRVPVAPG